MTNRASIAVATAFALSFGFSSPAAARTWGKYHQTINLGGVIAEYTIIATSDGASPLSKRILYKDDQGTLLVIRYDTPFTTGTDGTISATSVQNSITILNTGEVLTISMPNSTAQITCSVGTGSVSFTDQDPISSSVRQAATAMLQADASQGFQTALRRFAVVSLAYSSDNLDLGSSLRGLFFPDIVVVAPQDYTTDPTDRIKNFDPNVNGPGTFDQQFGQAYYQ